MGIFADGKGNREKEKSFVAAFYGLKDYAN